MKGKAVASMVLGIVACVIAWIGWFSIGGIVCGVLAIVLAATSRKGEAKGMATAGLVLGIIGLVLASIGFISCVVCAKLLKEASDQISGLCLAWGF